MPFIDAPAYKANLKRHILGSSNAVQRSVLENTSSIEAMDIDNIDIELEAGEDVTVDNAGAISGGKIYHASSLSSEARPPAGIILETVAAGSTVKMRIAGIINLDGIDGLTTGKKCFVRKGAPNISQAPPVAKSTDEDLVQSIGTAIGATAVYLRIETAHRLEC